MAKQQRKSVSVADVHSGKVPAKMNAGRTEKTEDFIRRTIVQRPSISQKEMIELVAKRGDDYALSSLNIAFSRYNATMKEVMAFYELKPKTNK